MTPQELLAAYRLGKTGVRAVRSTGRMIRRLVSAVIVLAVIIGLAAVGQKAGLLPKFPNFNKMQKQITGAFAEDDKEKKKSSKKSSKKKSKKKNATKNTNVAKQAKKRGYEKVKIQRVSDGDTLVLTDSRKVRMIGIDTPESVHATDSSNNTAWGKKVSDYTKKRLRPGNTIWLEYDKDKTDPYGRTLAYVWIKQKGKLQMYNKELVKKGYARAAYYSPNGAHRKEFESLQKQAKKNKKGFWKDGFKEAFPNKNE